MTRKVKIVKQKLYRKNTKTISKSKLKSNKKKKHTRWKRKIKNMRRKRKIKSVRFKKHKKSQKKKSYDNSFAKLSNKSSSIKYDGADLKTDNGNPTLDQRERQHQQQEEERRTTPALWDYNPINDIDNKRLKLKAIVGGGTFGVVYKGTYDGNNVAIKQLNAPIKPASQVDVIDFKTAVENEYNLLQKLRHPNIVFFYGKTVEPETATTWNMIDNVFIVTELCNTSLQEYIITGKLYTKPKIIDCLRDIAYGMYFLHSKKIIHRDLKLVNVLVNFPTNKNNLPSPVYKIADFGFTREINLDTSNDLTGKIGTPVYMAPELLLNDQTMINEYPLAGDIYAYGILAYCVLRNITHPYQDIKRKNRYNKEQLLFIIAYHDLRPDGSWAKKQFNTNDPLMKLIKKCWDKKPNLRPNFRTIFLELEKEAQKVEAGKRGWWWR